MASFFETITSEQRVLIEEAPLFFVATADPRGANGPDGQGAVNVSPKGGGSLLVLDERTVAWLDYAGSGDETARHVEAGSQATVMVMSISAADAAIVRLYGRVEIEPIAGSPHAPPLLAATRMETLVRPRRVFVLHVASTMTSCGYGVPVLEPRRERGGDGKGRRFKPVLVGQPEDGKDAEERLDAGVAEAERGRALGVDLDGLAGSGRRLAVRCDSPRSFV